MQGLEVSSRQLTIVNMNMYMNAYKRTPRK